MHNRRNTFLSNVADVAFLHNITGRIIVVIIIICFFFFLRKRRNLKLEELFVWTRVVNGMKTKEWASRA